MPATLRESGVGGGPSSLLCLSTVFHKPLLCVPTHKSPRRYMAEILQIRRKTLFNQSIINRHLTLTSVTDLWAVLTALILSVILFHTAWFF